MSTLSDSKLAAESSTIFSKIAELRGKIRSWLVIDGVSLAVIALLLVSFLSLNLDFFFKMTRPTRIVQWLLVNAVLIWWIKSKLIDPVNSELPDDELAIVVERHHPELDCKLVSAVQFLKLNSETGNASVELMTMTVRDAIESSESCDFLDCIDWQSTKNRLLQLFATIICVGVLVASPIYTFSDLSQQGKRRSALPIWLQRNILLQDVSWPKTTRLVVDIEGMHDKVVALPAGAPLEIKVQAEGVVPRQVYISWEATDDTLSEMARQLAIGQATFKKRGDNRFFYSIPAVETSIKVLIWGGDDEFGPIAVKIVRRPWIRKLQISAEFPRHTGLKAKQFAQGMGDLAIPEGTKLNLYAESSKPLTSAWLDLRAPAEPKLGTFRLPIKLDPANNQSLNIALVVSQTLIAKLDVSDLDNLNVESPTRLNFRAAKDRVPKLSTKVSGVGNLVTPQVTMPLTLKALDDYGITSGALQYKFTREERKPGSKKATQIVGEASIKVPEFAGKSEVQATKTWDLNELELKPGTFFSFWTEATDNDGVNKPKTGRSQVVSVRVVTREELMNDMIRRQAEQRRGFEFILNSQIELRKMIEKAPESRELAYRYGRRELSLSRKIAVVSRELTKIVAEMGNNKILEAKDRKRLSESIIDPLTRLVNVELPKSRRNFEKLGSDLKSEEQLEVTQQQVDEIIRLMEYVKAQMIRLETLTELLTRLEKIISDVDEVLDETRKQIPK